MGAKAAHGLRFARNAIAAHGVQTLGLDQGEGDIAVECCVMGEVNPLLAALAQEALDQIAAIHKGLGSPVSLLPLREKGRG